MKRSDFTFKETTYYQNSDIPNSTSYKQQLKPKL